LQDSKCHFVLTTHKHWDHAGGNHELKTSFPNALFYGSKVDSPIGIDNYIEDLDTLKMGSI